LVSTSGTKSSGRGVVLESRPPELFVIRESRKHVSKNFERWKELAACAAAEQDSARLTEIASEMNLTLIQKILTSDPLAVETLE
jgi:hypothetical protein